MSKANLQCQRLVKSVLSGVKYKCCCIMVLLTEAVGQVQMLRGSVDVPGCLQVVMGRG